MYFIDDVSDIDNVLRKGGIILTPTDTVWSLCCNALDENAAAQLARITPSTTDNPYIVLVPNIDWLKEIALDIHPRVETMLTLYKKPISIRYPKVQRLSTNLLQKDGSAFIRVVYDEFLSSIMEKTEAPLLSTPACHSGSNPPINYSDINQDILEAANYTSQYRRGDTSIQLESVIAQYDAKGELDFIRE